MNRLLMGDFHSQQENIPSKESKPFVLFKACSVTLLGIWLGRECWQVVRETGIMQLNA